MRRTVSAILLLVAMVALAAGPVAAGGWATVRLDAVPGEVRVGVPLRLGFMVLQHDVSPFPNAEARLTARHRQTGATVTAQVRAEGKVGHYVVEVVFPAAGRWKWEIASAPFAATSFETLTVLPAVAVAGGATPEGAASGPVAAVEIGDMRFAPARLEIAVGTTVTWTNRDLVVHTVTGDDLAFDDSGPLDPGAAFRQRFDAPGVFAYHCGPHPSMTGMIVVK